jgi:hypothetical protein
MARAQSQPYAKVPVPPGAGSVVPTVLVEGQLLVKIVYFIIIKQSTGDNYDHVATQLKLTVTFVVFASKIIF